MNDSERNHLKAGNYSRGYLPHVRVEGRPYFVTFRLEGTLSQELLRQYRAERDALLRKATLNGKVSPEDEQRLLELYSEKIEAYLDAGRGDCWLKAPRIAELVAGALRFFHGKRYDLSSWVIMPNHVHVIVRPEREHLLNEIIKVWKGYTAREANKLLSRTGESFWDREYYDHVIRTDDEKARFMAYIHDNPVKAGLSATPESWPWSSAYRNADIPVGQFQKSS